MEGILQLNRICNRCRKIFKASTRRGNNTLKDCPYRHETNDHCPEFEQIKKMLTERSLMFDYAKDIVEGVKNEMERLS